MADTSARAPTVWASPRASARSALASFWPEHGLPLVFYTLLSVGLTWPLARNFTSLIISSGGDDARLNIWMLWHTREALLGRQPLFGAPLIYYPQGLSLLTQSPGPLTGLFALPFWPLGAEAAYNGALLVSLILTGYCMYRLAREVRLDRGVAAFAGVALMVAPMCLEGLYQHIDKVFLGLLPLALLVTLRALDPQRRATWAIAPAVILLLAALHAGWHFLLAALGIGYLWLTAALSAWKEEGGRRKEETNRPSSIVHRPWRAALSTQHSRLSPPVGRGLLMLLAALVIVGPYLVATQLAVRGLALTNERNLQSVKHHPDLVQFFLPSDVSRLFGGWTAAFAEARGLTIGPFLEAHGLTVQVETAIFLTWTVLALVVVAALARPRGAWRWLGLGLICALLTLGPFLKVLGRKEFTEYHLPVLLPYAFLTGLPGLGFMRTPGRFMLLGFVVFALVAGFGLAWLTRRFPGARVPLVAGAMLLILLESWPQPWPQDFLRPAPAFYQQIASDPATYGVFDLPIKLRSSQSGTGYSSHYQIYQITHGKGIAAGFITYTPNPHPLFPCWYGTDLTPPDVFVNGDKVSCIVNASYELSRFGYRYVVQHKPQKIYSTYKPGTTADKLAQEFVATAFPNQAPIAEDDLATVYAIPPTVDLATLTTEMELREGWEEAEETQRWARSPATLYIVSPKEQVAQLEITPVAMHDPAAPQGVGTTGTLRVETDEGMTEVPLVGGQPTDIPVHLRPGHQTLRLSLVAGNFRPSDYGVPDGRRLSFSIRSLNLKTTP